MLIHALRGAEIDDVFCSYHNWWLSIRCPRRGGATAEAGRSPPGPFGRAVCSALFERHTSCRSLQPHAMPNRAARHGNFIGLSYVALKIAATLHRSTLDRDSVQAGQAM